MIIFIYLSSQKDDIKIDTNNLLKRVTQIQNKLRITLFLPTIPWLGWWMILVSIVVRDTLIIIIIIIIVYWVLLVYFFRLILGFNGR